MTPHQPVPELPVADEEKSQKYYRDTLGFDIEWIYPGKEVGAVSKGNVAIFFRKRTGPFEPTVHWLYVDDVDAAHETLRNSGAKYCG